MSKINHGIKEMLCVQYNKYNCKDCERFNGIKHELISGGIDPNIGVDGCRSVNTTVILKLVQIVRKLKGFNFIEVNDYGKCERMDCIMNENHKYHQGCYHFDDNWCEICGYFDPTASLQEEIKRLKFKINFPNYECNYISDIKHLDYQDDTCLHPNGKGQCSKESCPIRNKEIDKS